MFPFKKNLFKEQLKNYLGSLNKWKYSKRLSIAWMRSTVCMDVFHSMVCEIQNNSDIFKHIIIVLVIFSVAKSLSEISN